MTTRGRTEKAKMKHERDATSNYDEKNLEIRTPSKKRISKAGRPPPIGESHGAETFAGEREAAAPPPMAPRAP